MKRLMTVSILLILLVLNGCTHMTPFTDESYLRALGEESEVVATVNVDMAQALIHEVAGDQLESLEIILDRSDRISVAIDPSASEEETPMMYGGIEGDFGKIVTDTVLSFSKDFAKMEEQDIQYFGSDTMNLDVKVPKSGLVLFSNDSIEEVYQKTFKERELFIPYDVSERMEESLFGIYMEKPTDIGFLTDQIPETMLLSMNGIWLVLNGEKDSYNVSGILDTNTPQATRVLGTLLRLNYLKTIRKLPTPLEGWEDHILIGDEIITLAGMFISNEEVYDLFSMVLKNFY